MIFRKIREEDIIDIRSLIEHGIPFVLPHHHYVYWMMWKYFTNSNLVAIDENNVVGFVCAIPDENKKCYFIWQIVIDEEYRGMGIASELLDKLIESAKNNNITCLELTIDVNNRSSQKLFQNLAKRLGTELERTGNYEYDKNHDYTYQIRLDRSSE